MWKSVRKAWGLWRQGVSLVNLLKLLGIWKWIVLVGTLAAAVAVGFWARLPIWGQVLLALAFLTLILFIAGFTSALWTVWKDTSGITLACSLFDFSRSTEMQTEEGIVQRVHLVVIADLSNRGAETTVEIGGLSIRLEDYTVAASLVSLSGRYIPQWIAEDFAKVPHLEEVTHNMTIPSRCAVTRFVRFDADTPKVLLDQMEKRGVFTLTFFDALGTESRGKQSVTCSRYVRQQLHKYSFPVQ